MPVPPLPRLVARLEITNAQGQFDSASPLPVRGDGLDVPRIEFEVSKTLDNSPNTADIKIYNLSDERLDQITGTVRKRLEYTPEDRQELYESGLNLSQQQIALLTSAPVEVIYDNFGLGSVRLSWGYAGADPTSPAPPMSLGFIGGSRSMVAKSDGRSKILVIHAEDGGDLLGAGWLRKSYRTGASYIDVLADLVAACGLSVDKAKLEQAMASALIARGIPVGKLQLYQGYPAGQAPAAEQIRTVMDSLQLRWSIQDGEFLLLDSNTVLAGYSPLVLSREDFSLFDSPEQLEAGSLAAKTWANAEARPGREAQVLANNLTTQYRIDAVKTVGSTESGGVSELTLDAIQVIPGVF